LEDAMDLREAIKRVEKFGTGLSEPGCILSGYDVQLVVDAAKRELEREEKERPKRRSLEVLEGVSRNRSVWLHEERNHDDGTSYGQIADILKALREVVVPNLKRIGELSEEIKYGPGEALSFEALKALGESP